MSFSIVIPSRSPANLVPCIRAIRAAGERARIIVVDDMPYPLPRGFNWHESGLDLSRDLVVTGRDPFVFARNVNLGIEAAGDDDVILLNDDALLQTPGGFTALSNMAMLPAYGVISSACNNVGNVRQHISGHDRQCPRYIAMFGAAGVECRHGFDACPECDPCTCRPGGLRDEPRMVCFVCVLIPRRTIQAVGLLDPRFVGYGMDDDDYCLRVRNAGLKIGIFDGCYVDHGSLTSSFRGAAGAGGDFMPNMKLFIEKWGVDNRGEGRNKSRYRGLFPAA